eukprot:TRINITY_DN18227_c0_g1_i2.p1 TRINITY_DN18227_c0_g1~~TRINITY_DN18227_c0_g1_i2.p1  ORF type:complete len:544 (+),score=187.15 TRINITY_DN18227_c0_g1_i2:79-1632(+)
MPAEAQTRARAWRQTLAAAAATAKAQPAPQPPPPDGPPAGTLTAWGWEAARPAAEGPAAAIPRLWPGGPPSDLVFACRQDERAIALERIGSQFPEEFAVIDSFHSLGADPDQPADEKREGGPEWWVPSLAAYRRLVEKLLPVGDPTQTFHSNSLLTPSDLFLAGRGEGTGTATSGMTLCAHAARKVLLYRIRIMLEQHDSGGEGMLCETDFEEFIDRIIPHLHAVRDWEKIRMMPCGQKVPPNYNVFYRCHAVRKFCFFLEERGRMSIDAVMASSELMELLKLYQPYPNDAELTEEEIAMDDDNWFSFSTALRFYQIYTDLDENWNGMLDKQELYKYHGGCFSPLFIDRVFEVYPTPGYADEIDFKKFLEFVIATEHPSTPRGCKWFWRILDIGNCGFLAPGHVFQFARELAATLQQSGSLIIDAEDIRREFFDMVNPRDPERITLQDLLNLPPYRGRFPAHVVLVDHRSFYLYDQMEQEISDRSQQARADMQGTADNGDAPPPADQQGGDASWARP